MSETVKINDKAWRELRTRIGRLGKSFAKVGIVGDNAGNDHGGASNAEIGAALHYGTESIPPRPFITQAMAQRKAELAKLQGKLARMVIYNQATAEQVLGLLGAWGAGAIKATITSTGNFAPNAPSTIARKGSSRPLVDTGQLVSSISFVVVE